MARGSNKTGTKRGGGNVLGGRSRGKRPSGASMGPSTRMGNGASKMPGNGKPAK